jgi:hypothetical protein
MLTNPVLTQQPVAKISLGRGDVNTNADWAIGDSIQRHRFDDSDHAWPSSHCTGLGTVIEPLQHRPRRSLGWRLAAQAQGKVPFAKRLSVVQPSRRQRET